MPPLDEITVLITGATDGLGREVARELAVRGASVIAHGRDPARCEGTVEEIRSATGNDRLEYVVADLASLERVRGLAAEVVGRCERLAVLINNAGVGAGRQGGEGREVTPAGSSASRPESLRRLLRE